MKRTASKKSKHLQHKNLSREPHQNWLKIYSHVAYVFSALNLFLFPARANLEAAPARMACDHSPCFTARQFVLRDQQHSICPNTGPGLSDFSHGASGGMVDKIPVISAGRACDSVVSRWCTVSWRAEGARRSISTPSTCRPIINPFEIPTLSAEARGLDFGD